MSQIQKDRLLTAVSTRTLGRLVHPQVHRPRNVPLPLVRVVADLVELVVGVPAEALGRDADAVLGAGAGVAAAGAVAAGAPDVPGLAGAELVAQVVGVLVAALGLHGDGGGGGRDAGAVGLGEDGEFVVGLVALRRDRDGDGIAGGGGADEGRGGDGLGC